MATNLNIYAVLQRSGDERPDGWRMLAAVGDQWTCAYLRIGANGESMLDAPWLFAGGHALELYLKAAVSRATSMDDASAYGHRMRALWEAAQRLDGFPIRVDLRAHLLAPDVLFGNVLSNGVDPLADDDRRHLLHNLGLYRAIGHVQHLKYMGIPGKATPDTSGYTFTHPDKAFIVILCALRSWLGATGAHDDEIAALARRYLL